MTPAKLLRARRAFFGVGGALIVAAPLVAFGVALALPPASAFLGSAFLLALLGLIGAGCWALELGRTCGELHREHVRQQCERARALERRGTPALMQGVTVRVARGSGVAFFFAWLLACALDARAGREP